MVCKADGSEIVATVNSIAMKGVETNIVIHGINSTTNRKIRRAFLSKAPEAFNHRDTSTHDEAIDAGAVAILCKTLRSEVRRNATSDSISCICQALEMVYHRCSPIKAKTSFCTIGSGLLPLLLQVVEACSGDNSNNTNNKTEGEKEEEEEDGERNQQYDDGEDHHQKHLKTDSTSKSLMRVAVRVIDKLTSLEINITSMKKHNDLIRFLLGVLDHSDDHAHPTVHAATMILSNLCQSVESKIAMARFPGIVASFINMATNSITTTTSSNNHKNKAASSHSSIMSLSRDDTRMEAAKALQGLAWEATNKSLLAQHKGCIDALARLSEDYRYGTRSYAIGALLHLSTAAENKEALTMHGVVTDCGDDDTAGGNNSTSSKNKLKTVRLMDMLLRSAKDFLKREPCIGANKILANLACRNTARKIGNHPHLINALSSIALDCPHEQASIFAAMCIRKLATDMTIKDQCYDHLLTALVKMAASPLPSVRLWTTKAFVDQTMVVKNRTVASSFQGVLKSLSTLATDFKYEIRSFALEALSYLSFESKSATSIAWDDQAMEAIVNATKQIQHSHDEENNESDHYDETDNNNDNKTTTMTPQKHAIKAILGLATHGATAKKVAKYPGSVSSLSIYGSSDDTDDELKRAATQGVVLLAPLL